MKGKFKYKIEMVNYFKKFSYKEKEKYVNSLDGKIRLKEEKISMLQDKR